MDKLSTARSRLLINQPFFGMLVVNTPIVAVENDPRVKRAATDMRKIYYNPAFFDSLPVDQIAFVLAHEIMHIALKHGFRKRSRDHMLWNKAGDHVINLALKASKFTLWPNCLCDPKYAGWYSEQVYDDLVKNGADGSQGNAAGGDGEIGSGDVLLPGDIGGDPMSPAEQAMAEVQISQNVAQAAQMARMAGKMPGELDDLVRGILEPKVLWTEELRDQMTRKRPEDTYWKRRNRRYRDVYLPTLDGQAMGELVIIVDTSGSMFSELEQAASEIQDIAMTVKPEKIRVVWADTRVANEQTFDVGEELTLRVKGGGGTDMRVPLQHVEQYDPEMVVLLTDGYTPWPDAEPPYPLIVVCSSKVDVPVGHAIHTT